MQRQTLNIFLLSKIGILNLQGCKTGINVIFKIFYYFYYISIYNYNNYYIYIFIYMNKIVIEETKELLLSSNEKLYKYYFYTKKNIVFMKKDKKYVKIKYYLFSDEQIINKDPKWITYLRVKINELFDIINKPCVVKTDKKVYVLVHGAWHMGPLLKKTAYYLRKKGNIVYTPTVTGNKPGDNRAVINLTDAITSIINYIVGLNLNNVILLGHSYGGMVISGVVDKIKSRITRLIYWDAFVPLNGQSLNDMVPENYKILFKTLAEQNNNSILLPFPIWREVFVNNSDYKSALNYYNQLNPHPYLTFTEPIYFVNFKELAYLDIGKSYIYGLTDNALPQSNGWLLLSERLGLCRLVENKYDHEICFSYPKVLANQIIDAGRD